MNAGRLCFFILRSVCLSYLSPYPRGECRRNQIGTVFVHNGQESPPDGDVLAGCLGPCAEAATAIKVQGLGIRVYCRIGSRIQAATAIKCCFAYRVDENAATIWSFEHFCMRDLVCLLSSVPCTRSLHTILTMYRPLLNATSAKSTAKWKIHQKIRRVIVKKRNCSRALVWTVRGLQCLINKRIKSIRIAGFKQSPLETCRLEVDQNTLPASHLRSPDLIAAYRDSFSQDLLMMPGPKALAAALSSRLFFRHSRV
jgi:hypothetical protein